MRLARTILIGIVLAGSARAELPLDPPVTETTTNILPGIVVPKPKRGGTSTNETLIAPAIPPRREPAPQYHMGQQGWKLAAAEPRRNDELAWREGETLPGRLLSLDPVLVGWQLPAATGPVRFRTGVISGVQLAAPANAAETKPPRWVVRLSNGSTLAGTALVADREAVWLESHYAGWLRLARDMVAALYRDPQEDGQGETLQNLATWPRVEGTANFGQMQNLIYRELRLPDAALLEFDLPQANQAFTAYLFVSSFRSLYAEPMVLVNGGNGRIVLQVLGQNFGENATVTLPKTRRPFWRVGLAFNRTSGKVALYVDDKFMRHFQMNGLISPKAGNLMFGSPQPGLPLRAVTWTRISDDLALPAATPEEDLLRLVNGDAIAGQLESITAREATFVGTAGRITFPQERLLSVVCARATQAEPRRRLGDVTLLLADGCALTAELKGFGAETLPMESDLFGEAAFPRAAVRAVQFGIYDPRPKAAKRDGVEADERRPGTLQLQSGETLPGQLAGLTTETLLWQHPAALEPIPLLREHVKFANPVPAPAAAEHQDQPARAHVRLTNGDDICGELVGLDRDRLQMRINDKTLLAIPRRHVESLRPRAAPTNVVAAAADATQLSSPDARKRSLTNARHFSRELALPTRVAIQCEVSGPPGRWHFRLDVFAKPPGKNQPSQAGYGVGLQGTTITLEHAGSAPSAPKTVTELGALGRAQVTLLVDAAKNETCVYINDKLVNSLRGQRPNMTSTNLHVMLGPPGMQARHLVVSEWATPFPAGNEPAPKTDSVRLHDQTRLDGEVEGISEGHLLLHAGGRLPLGRVAVVQFRSADTVRARRHKDDVKLLLAGGDQMTLRALRGDQQGWTGNSEALGEVVLPPGLVAHLDIRPYDPPPKPAAQKPRVFYGLPFGDNQLE